MLSTATSAVGLINLSG